MTTQEIAKYVKSFGVDEDAAFDALLKKLVAGDLSIKEVEDAIGEQSEAYPYGYPNVDPVMVIPSFVEELAVALEQEKGNSRAFCC